MEIWSGGQTGVDRAALDAALELGWRIGGWVPLGRMAEDGTVPDRHAALREATSPEWSHRTLLNVRDTDATLVLTWGPATGGTLETVGFAAAEHRPCLQLDLAQHGVASAGRAISGWLDSLPEVARLNVAGPRASTAPEAYRRALDVMRFVLASRARPDGGSGGAGRAQG